MGFENLPDHDDRPEIVTLFTAWQSSMAGTLPDRRA
jgi:hypothetical protein